MQFGELISDMRFSQDEQARILHSLTDDSTLSARVFRAALKSGSITEPKFCAWAANKLKLKGDRDGGDSQRDKILGRCTSFAAGTPTMDAGLFWGIYRAAISKYVASKLPSLQKLLLETKHDSLSVSTADVFKKLLALKSAFNVSLSDIQCLYEIWGFSRDTEIEQLLKASAPIINSEEVEELRSSLNDLRTQFKTQLAEFEKSLSSAVSELEESGKETTTSIQQLKKDLTKLGNDVNTRFDNFGKAVENIRKDVRSLPDQKAIKAIKSDIEELDDRQTSAANAISKLEDAVAKQFKELSRVNEKIGRKFLSVTSTDSKSVRKIDAGKSRIEEIEFVQYWQSKLARTPFENLQIDDLLAAHIFFKLFPCFILNDSMLFDSWTGSLGWSQFCKTTVAEPIWLKSEDCRELTNFVITDEAPTVLKIAQFNSAIPDGYLLPNAVAWLSTEEFVDRKLVLVAANEDESALGEVAARFPFMMSRYGRLEPGPVVAQRPPVSSVSDDKLLISTLAIWAPKKVESLESNRDILSVLKSLDLEIPPVVLLNFSKLREAYAEVFDPSSALLAAFQLTIYPWLRYCANEIHAEQISQNLKVLYG